MDIKRMTLELNGEDAAKFEESRALSGAESLAGTARAALRLYWNLLRAREDRCRIFIVGAGGERSEVELPGGLRVTSAVRISAAGSESQPWLDWPDWAEDVKEFARLGPAARETLVRHLAHGANLSEDQEWRLASDLSRAVLRPGDSWEEQDLVKDLPEDAQGAKE